MTIPTKTALGQEELKSRANRIGQRHRTILFLVDGRRPLSEVLNLAQQAGAAIRHFEDLVRLGLVEVPAEPEPPPPAPPEEPDAPLVTAVAIDVPQPGIELPEEPPPPHFDDTVPASGFEPTRPLDAPSALPPEPPAAAGASPAGRPLPVLRFDAAVDALQQVRELLIDTLRLDAPLFSARMFMRVRNAQTGPELVELVWEIQTHLTRSRHSQRELRSLQQARELLGLGNTVVADDSTRPPHDDE